MELRQEEVEEKTLTTITSGNIFIGGIIKEKQMWHYERLNLTASMIWHGVWILHGLHLHFIINVVGSWKEIELNTRNQMERKIENKK